MTKKLTKAEQETWDAISTPPPNPKSWWANLDANSMYPFQANLTKMLQGYAKGEKVVIMAASQGSGKSMFAAELAMKQTYGRAKRK